MITGTHTNSRRFASLDYFRGCAALWVMAFHAYAGWIVSGSLPHVPVLSWILLNGWLGVQVFFVVSGYCITERLARDWTTAAPIRCFLADRGWRILPAYWAALAFSIGLNVVTVPLNHSPLFTTPGKPGALPAALIDWARMLTLEEVWFGSTAYLIVSWTLAYEIAFYGLAALCLLAARRLGRPDAAFVLAFAFMVIGALPFGSMFPVLESWPQFVAGAGVWLWLNGTRLDRSLATTLGAIALTTVAAALALHRDDLQGTVVLVTVAALALAHRFDAKLAGLKGLQWLLVVGTWSYSLYLIHVPVISKLRNFAGRWLEFSPVSWTVPLACCLVAILVARFFFLAVERRSESARRSGAGRMASPQVVPTR